MDWKPRLHLSGWLANLSSKSSSTAYYFAQTPLLSENFEATDVWTVHVSIVAYRIIHWASSRMTPLRYLGADCGISQPVRANIQNFVLVTCDTHSGGGPAIVFSVVEYDVLHKARSRRVAKIRGWSPLIVPLLITSSLLWNRCQATSMKWTLKLQQRKNNGENRIAKVKRGSKKAQKRRGKK